MCPPGKTGPGPCDAGGGTKDKKPKLNLTPLQQHKRKVIFDALCDAMAKEGRRLCFEIKEGK